LSSDLTARASRHSSNSRWLRCCPGSVFVNADEIARHRWPDDPASHAYAAARVAADTRAKLLELGTSFIAETVFSHPSKLELIEAAHTADYTIALHVLLIPEELAVHRVRHRVSAGGHHVPEDKIRERYKRLWPLVATATTRCDLTTVYDNSGLKGPRIVTQLNDGFVVGSTDWPAWTPRALQALVDPEESAGSTFRQSRSGQE
jgi:predicted ABC-type ATPase